MEGRSVGTNQAVLIIHFPRAEHHLEHKIKAVLMPCVLVIGKLFDLPQEAFEDDELPFVKEKREGVHLLNHPN